MIVASENFRYVFKAAASGRCAGSKKPSVRPGYRQRWALAVQTGYLGRNPIRSRKYCSAISLSAMPTGMIP